MTEEELGLASSSEENEEFQPTLIIGLGGTGKKVVTRLKTRLYEQFGTVPPTIRLMVFDIDIKEERDTLGEREITLTPGEEMIDLGDVPAGDIIQEVKRKQYTELLDWFWPDVPLLEANLRRGGQQNRQLGRLAFFWNLRARQLYRALESAVTYLRQQGLDARIGEVERRRGGELVIYLIGSLAGGTGSGIALDMAYLLRYIANALGILDTTSIVGVFVLPRVFDMVRQDTLQANTLAALQELDYFMTRPANERRFGRIRYIDGSPVTQVDCSDRPFNLCYLIDAISAKGETLPSIERLLPMVVDSVYLLAVSKMGAMAWSNVNNLGRRFEGTRVFSSFGVASLVFPASQIQHICASRIGREVVSTILSEPTDEAMDNLGRELERYMAQQPLTYNDLIGRLQMAADGRQIMLNLLSDERLSNARLDAIPKDHWYMSVTRQVDEIISVWEAGVRKRIEANRETVLAKLLEDETSGLRYKLQGLVNSPEYGVNYAVKFLESLEAQLRSLETEIERRRSEAAVNKEAIQKQRAQSAANFDEQVRRAGRFLTRANPKGARDQYLRDSNSWLQHMFSLETHTQAKALLAQFARHVAQMREELNRLIGNLRYVHDTFLPEKEKIYLREIAEMDTVRRKPITRMQDIDRLYDERREAAKHKVVQQVLAGDVPRGGEGMFGLLSASADEVGQVIYNTALHNFEDILQIRLESIIEARAKDRTHPVEVSEWLRDLHSNADVFWKYAEATVAGTAEADIAADFVVTGVEDTKTSIYKEAGSRAQSYCSTGDPHRITVLQMKHALDYRHIKQYDEFRTNYRKLVRRRYPLHIFPEFSAVDDRAKSTFVGGYVYGFVTRSGAVFYCKGPDGKPVQLNKSDQGLTDALWTFAHEQRGKLVEHVAKLLDDKLYGAEVTDDDRRKFLEEGRDKAAHLNLVSDDADPDNQLLAEEMQEFLEAFLRKIERG